MNGIYPLVKELDLTTVSYSNSPSPKRIGIVGGYYPEFCCSSSNSTDVINGNQTIKLPVTVVPHSLKENPNIAISRARSDKDLLVQNFSSRGLFVLNVITSRIVLLKRHQTKKINNGDILFLAFSDFLMEEYKKHKLISSKYLITLAFEESSLQMVIFTDYLNDLYIKFFTNEDNCKFSNLQDIKDFFLLDFAKGNLKDECCSSNIQTERINQIYRKEFLQISRNKTTDDEQFDSSNLQDVYHSDSVKLQSLLDMDKNYTNKTIEKDIREFHIKKKRLYSEVVAAEKFILDSKKNEILIKSLNHQMNKRNKAIKLLKKNIQNKDNEYVGVPFFILGVVSFYASIFAYVAYYPPN